MLMMMSACGGDAATQAAGAVEVVRGTVFYRERMLLPPGAELVVRLEDAARADVAAVEIASTRIVLEGGPPYAFELAFEPSKLESDRSGYSLRARIEHDGRLMFANDTRINAFGAQAEPSIMVVRVAAAATSSAASDATDAHSGLAGTYRVTTLKGAAAPAGMGDQPLTVTFDRDQQQIAGFSGCNRFTGSFEVDGDRLSIGGMASTMMACPDGMEVERNFLAALATVTGHAREGGAVLLTGEDGVVLMRVEPGPGA
jgi:putative lipoprotein